MTDAKSSRFEVDAGRGSLVLLLLQPRLRRSSIVEQRKTVPRLRVWPEAARQDHRGEGPVQEDRPSIRIFPRSRGPATGHGQAHSWLLTHSSREGMSQPWSKYPWICSCVHCGKVFIASAICGLTSAAGAPDGMFTTCLAVVRPRSRRTRHRRPRPSRHRHGGGAPSQGWPTRRPRRPNRRARGPWPRLGLRRSGP